MPKPNPKTPNAWSLVFVGGPLEPMKDRWTIGCPDDWACTVDGVTSRYVLKERDDARKVATLELEHA